jgi:isopentenyldiphosphate isomerase
MEDEILDIVNDKDEVIGSAARSDIYRKQEMHRIVHAFVVNDKGEIALQLRSKNKTFCTLHWCTAAGGHVLTGENYKDAISREIKEEIGIEIDCRMIGKWDYWCPVKKGLRKFLGVFEAIYNGPFTVDLEEVDEIRFFCLDEIRQMINNKGKLHPELIFLLEKYYL